MKDGGLSRVEVRHATRGIKRKRDAQRPIKSEPRRGVEVVDAPEAHVLSHNAHVRLFDARAHHYDDAWVPQLRDQLDLLQKIVEGLLVHRLAPGWRLKRPALRGRRRLHGQECTAAIRASAHSEGLCRQRLAVALLLHLGRDARRPPAHLSKPRDSARHPPPKAGKVTHGPRHGAVHGELDNRRGGDGPVRLSRGGRVLVAKLSGREGRRHATGRLPPRRLRVVAPLVLREVEGSANVRHFTGVVDHAVRRHARALGRRRGAQTGLRIDERLDVVRHRNCIVSGRRRRVRVRLLPARPRAAPNGRGGLGHSQLRLNVVRGEGPWERRTPHFRAAARRTHGDGWSLCRVALVERVARVVAKCGLHFARARKQLRVRRNDRPAARVGALAGADERRVAVPLAVPVALQPHGRGDALGDARGKRVAFAKHEQLLENVRRYVSRRVVGRARRVHARAARIAKERGAACELRPAGVTRRRLLDRDEARRAQRRLFPGRRDHRRRDARRERVPLAKEEKGVHVDGRRHPRDVRGVRDPAGHPLKSGRCSRGGAAHVRMLGEGYKARPLAGPQHFDGDDRAAPDALVHDAKGPFADPCTLR
eukprot:Opistho-1_new@75980